jgi:uncharacterized heparinase superfamily protein
MNLTPYYIYINKVVALASGFINHFLRILPVKWILKIHISRVESKTNKQSLQKDLARILGNFNKFPIELNIRETENILHWAEKSLLHEFEYLGIGLQKIEPIDWHTDVKSGFRWKPGKFYKSYRWSSKFKGIDVKVPWELSRCHHLLWLGQAYLIKGDEKYANEIVEQIEDWIQANPLMYSINWTCSMEVAIRAVNWMYAVNMIIASPAVTDSFSKKLISSLYAHGYFIYRNLEKWYPYSANHYAANVVGLLFLGLLFEQRKEGKTWYLFAEDEYYSEVRMQVLPSGVHFERTTSYHRLVTEFFLYSYLLLQRTGRTIPVDIKSRVESMLKFVMHIIRPDGSIPLIGDNDDGMLLPFCKNNISDLRYLLSVGAIAFTNSNFYYHSKGYTPDCFFLLGQITLPQNITNLSNDCRLPVIIYGDAGFGLLRKSEYYVFFNNNGFSCYANNRRITNSTHTHADHLSFELSYAGIPVIVDPGTYVYTSDPVARNKFRSTKAHNTVIFNQTDQYGIPSDDLFSMTHYSRLKNLELTYGENEINGVYSLSSPGKGIIIHNRKIAFNVNKHNLEIHDSFSFIGEQFLQWKFHVAPDKKVELRDGKIYINVSSKYTLLFEFVHTQKINIDILNDLVSPSYGVLQDSKTICVSVQCTSEFVLSTFITSIV